MAIKKFRIYNEDTLQIAVVAFCRSKGINIYHVPNGAKLEKRAAGRQHSQGVLNGVPDLQLDKPVYPYHGYRLELKWDSRPLRKDQVVRLTDLHNEGYAISVTDDYQTAITSIANYMNGNHVKQSLQNIFGKYHK